MQFLSSSVITRLTGRNRTLKGDNNSWLWFTTKIVTCHSFRKMSINFRNTIVRRALHPHFKDFLFRYSLDESTIFSGCLPSRWQKKLHLPISPFFFLQMTFLNCKTILICIIFIENESFFFTKKTSTNKRLKFIFYWIYILIFFNNSHLIYWTFIPINYFPSTCVIIFSIIRKLI